MSGSHSVEDMFIRWNTLGTGSGHLVAGNWRFRKTAMYYQDRPYKRFINDAKGVPLMLRRLRADEPSFKVSPTQAIWNKDVAYQYWTLPEIGVLSRFEGDMLSEDELHERHKYLFFAELRAVSDERVRTMPGHALQDEASKILALVDRMYARYWNYGQTFRLKWPEMPKMYKEEVIETIRERLKRYHDPKQVAARERAHARKIAKKAFGL